MAALGLIAVALSGTGSAQARPDAGADSAGQSSVTLDGLLARFRTIPGLYARYKEEKHVALLAEPIVSEGTVHYAPPRRMARHTRTPSPSHVVLDAEALRFSDGTTTRQIDIGASPVVRALAESFLDVLAGDRAGLERSFVIEFHAGDAANHASTWKLDLVPRTPELLGVLSEIQFEGQGLVVSQMRIREASGDEGTTTFSDVDVSHRYSPEEAARVFRVDP
jgi:outer membrane lipoprotein carrier protein LolA